MNETVVNMTGNPRASLTMNTNGPSAAAAAAAVAGVLAHPARRATPETLSLDSVVTQPSPAATDTAASNVPVTQVGMHRQVGSTRSTVSGDEGTRLRQKLKMAALRCSAARGGDLTSLRF